MPAFLCSVPLPVSRPLFLFCRMLSGLFVCLFPGIGCRLSSFCSRVFSPALFLCPVPRGIPRFPFFFSPASGAGVLPPLWRGKVFPFTVQSRDHLVTITDIYVPSFLRPVRGSLAPRLLSSIPPDDKLLHGTKNHTLRQIFIFHFINLSMLFFDYFFHKDIEIYELRFTA